MMHWVFRVFLFALFCSSASGQTATVDKTILDPGTPNLFFESIFLALNEKTGQTLVTWERHPGNHPGHSTFSRKLSRSGNPSASTKTLVTGTNTYDPGIVYNKNRNEFAMIYADEVAGAQHTIYIQKLTKSGVKKGAPVKVSTDTGSAFLNLGPELEYDPVQKVYVVSWQRSSTTSTGSGIGIFAAVLNEEFQMLFGPQLILSPASQIFPDIADIAITPAGKILIGINQYVNDNPLRVNYIIASMNHDLTGLVLSKVNRNPAGPPIPDLRFVSLTSEFLVYYTDTNGIRKRKINQQGKPFGPRTTTFAAPLKRKKLLRPVVTALHVPSGDVHGFLAASEDPAQLQGIGKLWGQALDAKGKALGQPVELDSNFMHLHSPAIVALPSSPSAEPQFALMYSDGAQIWLPPQGEFSRLIYLKITLNLP
jgi:hypothetical protein